MRIFEMLAGSIDAAEVWSQIFGQRNAGGADALFRNRQARSNSRGMVDAPLVDVYDFNGDSAFGASLGAGRSIAVGKAVVALVALANNPARGVVLRDTLGAVPRAVLTANASIRAVQYQAGLRVLGVSFDGAAS
jgi:hypothetical protein